MAKGKKIVTPEVVEATPVLTPQESFSLARVEAPEMLAPIIKEYGLTIPDEKVDAHLKKFLPYVTTLVELEPEFQKILTATEITPELSEEAKALRKKYRDTRGESSETKAVEKRDMVVEGRLLDKLDNAITDGAKEKESKLLEVEKHIENVALAAKQKIKDERKNILDALDYDTEFLTLEDMPEASFSKLVEKATAAKKGADAVAELEQQRKEKEAKDEQDRKDAEAKVRGRVSMLLGIGLKPDSANNKYAGEAGSIDNDVIEFFKDADFEKHYNILKKKYDESEQIKADALKVEREAKERITNRIKAVSGLGLTFNAGAERYEGFGQKFATKDINDLSAEEFKDELDRVKEMVESRKKIETAAQRVKDDQLKKLQAAENKRKADELEVEEKKRLAGLAPDKDKFKAFYNNFKAFSNDVPVFATKEGKEIEVSINTILKFALNQLKGEAAKLV